jgi:hypothetical protein
VLNNDPDIGADLEPWLVNLARLGIDASIRQVDFALFDKRINVFDFDVTELNYGEFLQPSATLLKSFYGSDQVDKEGSYNYGGVADPALDAAMAAMDAATTLEALRDAAHAFDRVFMQQHYVVPWSRRPAFNSAWWDRLGIPTQRPRYFTMINDTNNALPWPIQTCGRHRTVEANDDPLHRTRLLLMLPTLLGVLVATFILIQFVPGGPVEQTLAQLRQRQQQTGHGGELDATQVAAIKKLYGFDKPPLERFWLTLSSFSRFDFGTSFQNNRDVWELIKDKLPVSISLGVWSFLAAYLLSIPLGIPKAVREGSRFDALSSLAVLAASRCPVRARRRSSCLLRRHLFRPVPAARADLGQLVGAVVASAHRRLLLAPGALWCA